MIILSIIGGVLGATVGAIGFKAGVAVGVATTIGGGAAAGLVGGTVGHIGNSMENFQKEISKIGENHIKNMDAGIKNVKEINNAVTEGVNELKSISSFAKKEVKNITSLIPGGITLTTGMLSGASLWAMDIHCNPTCENFNAELVRLTSIALSTAGIIMLAFSGIKFYKN